MTTQVGSSVAGLLLAAGAGRRIGGPKALRRDADGTSWLLRAVDVLREGGCDPVYVVLGAQAQAAAELLTGADVEVVVATDWQEGMGASLRAGLAAIQTDPSVLAQQVVVHLVDLPDVGPDLVRRLLDNADADESALVRARFGDRPGHPVLIGRAHWTALGAQLTGDEGARRYLREYGALDVDCSDLATGQDVDELPPNPGTTRSQDVR